jgi:hypothetical protein
MLAVPVTTGNSHILATAVGREGAAVLAKEHGGSTLLPDGTAVSYAYTAIDAAEYDAILA